MQLKAADYGDPDDWGINIGSSYTSKELMRQNFNFKGTTKTARLLENYDWEASDYTVYDFVKNDSIELIVGIITMSFDDVIDLLGDLVTIIGGVEVVSEAVSVATFKVEQYWNKYGKIVGDSDSYYHSGRTRIWKMGKLEGENAYESEVEDDFKSGDFNNNTAIMESIIDAYVAVNSY